MPHLKFTYPVKGRKVGEIAHVSAVQAQGYLRDGVAVKAAPPKPEPEPKVEAPAPAPPAASPKPGPKLPARKPKTSE